MQTRNLTRLYVCDECGRHVIFCASKGIDRRGKTPQGVIRPCPWCGKKTVMHYAARRTGEVIQLSTEGRTPQ